MIRDAHCSNRLQISSIQSFDQKRPKIRLKSTSGKKSEVNEAAIRCQCNLLHRCCTFAPSTTLVGSVPCQLWNSTYLKFYFWQYYRVYSPIVFGKKTDPNGLYIRKWLPQLAKFPDKYIYEPWEAPKKVQEVCSKVLDSIRYCIFCVQLTCTSFNNNDAMEMVYFKWESQNFYC